MAEVLDGTKAGAEGEAPQAPVKDLYEVGGVGIVIHQLLEGGYLHGDCMTVTGKTLAECVDLIDQFAATARAIRDDVIVLCHGGPIANPEDAGYILEHCNGVHGFYGASSMERLPTEVAIADQTRAFKKLRFAGSPVQ